MKKNLFLIATLMGMSFPLAQSTFFVKENTTVKVKQNTLLFVDGIAKMETYTNDNKLSNEGNVKITQGYTNAQGATDKKGGNFVNEYVPGSHYGQLIINNGANVSGQIRGVLKLADTFAYHPMAFPYKGYTAGAAVRDAFPGQTVKYYTFTPGGKYKYDVDRYKNPVFEWNNDIYTLDHLASTSQMMPGKYYAVNTLASSGVSADHKTNTTYDGVPNNEDVSITANAYTVSTKLATNKWGEAYGTYIDDFVVNMPAGWNTGIDDRLADTPANGFGDNIFYLGNPFTSNVNLAGDNGLSTFSSAVQAIYQFQTNTYTRAQGNASAVDRVNSQLIYTANGTGDNKALYLRPYHTVLVKTNGSTTFKFTQGMKTFDLKGVDAPNTVLKRGTTNATVYQVGMDVYDAQKRDTGSRFYVVAGDIYKAEDKGEGVETYTPSFDDTKLGVYTLQEKEDGSVSEELANGKTYINGVNTNYVGKPIRVVVNAPKGGKFTFKPRLNETLANSKYNFYFEDKKEGVVKKVTKDFEYTFEVPATTTDRFVMYWAKTPSTIAPKEVEEVKVAQTVVFQDASQYKVRFDKNWKKADIFVYSISGQLLYADKGVSTGSDYTLKLNNNSNVYIVKVLGDNGETVTEKIVK